MYVSTMREVNAIVKAYIASHAKVCFSSFEVRDWRDYKFLSKSGTFTVTDKL